MPSVKIYGAGSIGNHLAHACRGMGWQVLICDTDPAALERTRESIYPARYGKWDPAIRLVGNKEAGGESGEHFDMVFIGTPPESHIALAIEALEQHSPRIVMLEKPACDLSMAGADELLAAARSADVFLGIGYNHTLTPNTTRAGEILADGRLGKPLTIAVRWVEHWGGIFAAHPWLTGPASSYLGFSARGGGACGEHSHGINIFAHFAHLLDQGRVVQVTAVMDQVRHDGADYDRLAQLSLVTEHGLVGSVIQDVVTRPPVKELRIQGSKGFLEWQANRDADHDSVVYQCDDQGLKEQLFVKKRPDDFRPLIEHLGGLLSEGVGYATASPIALERGLDTMLVIAAAHRSHQTRSAVTIHYDGPQEHFRTRLTWE